MRNKKECEMSHKYFYIAFKLKENILDVLA